MRHTPAVNPVALRRHRRSHNLLARDHVGGWPFNRISSNPQVVGVAAAHRRYVITYVVFRIFFNYDFMRGARVSQSAPKGMFNGVSALVFYVTALAVMFLVLLFRFVAAHEVSSVMKQPVLRVVWTVIALAGAAVAFSIGVTGAGADPMAFLTQVTVPFIFGSIIVLHCFRTRSLPG